MKQSELLRSEAFKLEVALGKIPGIKAYEKFGQNPEIDTGTAPEDIWHGGGVYTGFPTGSAEELEIFSDNILDNGVTPNTGDRTVTISGLLNENYEEMPDVEITMNGTASVSLGSQTYLRANKIKVETAGSTGQNQGIFTLRHKITTANIFARMPAFRNQTTIMAFTVPAGRVIAIEKGNISMGRISGAAGSLEATIRIRPLGGVFSAVRDVYITNSQSYNYENNGFMVFEEKVDVKVTVEDVSDNDTFVSAEANGYIIDPDLFHDINI